MQLKPGFKFIDLFCGIGGFHQAIANIGGECVYACDINAQCREVYEDNYGIAPDKDITKIEAADIPEHDLLCAGFPCQAFSVAGMRRGFDDPTRGTLFFDVLRIMKHHKPPFALLENVSHLKYHDNGRTWQVIHDSLAEAGYNVSDEPITFSPHYIGIPQDRVRVFILCIRKDVGELPEFCFNLDNMPKCHAGTVLLDDDQIPDIEEYRLTDDEIELIDVWNDFVQNQPAEKNITFPIWSHALCRFEDSERVKNHTAGTKYVEHMIRKNEEYWKKYSEFCDQWLKKTKGVKLFYGVKTQLEWQAGADATRNIWDKVFQLRPSGVRVKRTDYFPTLVTISTQVPVVGWLRRRLTPRECARLQSFPDTFKIPQNRKLAYKQFGNSVNVAVVELFARFLLGDEEVRRQYSRENQMKGSEASD